MQCEIEEIVVYVLVVEVWVEVWIVGVWILVVVGGFDQLIYVEQGWIQVGC